MEFQSPLLTIFEKHLIDRIKCNIDRQTFINIVVEDFLRLSQTPPTRLLELALENEILRMLTVRLYGVSSPEEFERSIKPKHVRKTQTAYRRLFGRISLSPESL